MRVSITEKVEEATERTPQRMTIREDVSDGADEEIRSLVEAENYIGLVAQLVEHARISYPEFTSAYSSSCFLNKY